MGIAAHAQLEPSEARLRESAIDQREDEGEEGRGVDSRREDATTTLQTPDPVAELAKLGWKIDEETTHGPCGRFTI